MANWTQDTRMSTDWSGEKMKMLANPTLERRFWAKVAKGGPTNCWQWTAHQDRQGYGRIGVMEPKEQMVRAHRVSWEIVNGPIPKGLCVLHHCDSPPCVNPAHLFLGTKGDNNRDAAAKGRGKVPRLRGETNGHSKLTKADVREIRRLSTAGVPQRKIAARFGCDQTNVGLIARRKTWAHVEGG